jgi:hypothetical protein
VLIRVACLDSFTLVRLLETAKRLIRELRNWDIAPLGAVLVATVLGAGAFAFIVTAEHKPPHSRFEATIRTYFETKRGPRVPHDQVRLIHVRSCTRFPYPDVILGVLQTQPIYKCSISFEDQRFAACFAINQGRVDPDDRPAPGRLDDQPRAVVAGSAELKAPELGCPLVGWNARSRSLVVN